MLPGASTSQPISRGFLSPPSAFYHFRLSYPAQSWEPFVLSYEATVIPVFLQHPLVTFQTWSLRDLSCILLFTGGKMRGIVMALWLRGLSSGSARGQAQGDMG